MAVCVIMSTFNGTKYVNKQLDSIFEQEVDEKIIVFIRDDGSIDKTIEMIEQRDEYKKEKIVISRGENLGAAKSFLEALRKAPDAEYYCFCDQDDVWKKGKIKKAKEVLRKKRTPALWISNFDVVDQNLKIIKKKAISEPVMDQLRVLFYNNVPGCTMVFNNLLMNEVRKLEIDAIRMHDIMLLNIALIRGEVFFENESYIFYRQHGDNVIGYTSKKVHIDKWIKDKFFLLRNKEPYRLGKYAEQILRLYSDILQEEVRQEYSLIAEYKKGINRFRLLRRDYTRIGWCRTGVSIRMKLLLGLM